MAIRDQMTFPHHKQDCGQQAAHAWDSTVACSCSPIQGDKVPAEGTVAKAGLLSTEEQSSDLLFSA